MYVASFPSLFFELSLFITIATIHRMMILGFSMCSLQIKSSCKILLNNSSFYKNKLHKETLYLIRRSHLLCMVLFQNCITYVSFISVKSSHAHIRVVNKKMRTFVLGTNPAASPCRLLK